MTTKSDYELCEQENTNLRAALAWAVQRLAVADQNTLERMLQQPLDAGGIACQEDEQIGEMEQTITKLVKFLEKLATNWPRPIQAMTFLELDQLLTEARQYTPKHPVLRRVGTKLVKILETRAGGHVIGEYIPPPKDND